MIRMLHIHTHIHMYATTITGKVGHEFEGEHREIHGRVFREEMKGGK